MMLLLLLMLLLLATVTTAQTAVPVLPRELMCCPLLRHGHTEEFERCAREFDPPPNCEEYQTKCLYNSKWYVNGQTILLMPEKCVKLACMAPEPTQEKKWPMVQAESVHPGMNCCESRGQLHPSGHVVNSHVQRCTREVCANGTWLTQVDNNCCIFEEHVYFPDEVIDHGPGGDDCWRRWCSNGDVVKTPLPCCCVQGAKVFDCGTTLLSAVDSCDVDMCVEGRIVRSDNPGCCIVSGNLYKNNDVVGPSASRCLHHRCVDGDVQELPSGECCRNLDGRWVFPNDVVEGNEKKCLLKVCEGNNSIVDRSLEDDCDCCLLGNQLYKEDTVVPLSPCVSLVCRSNIWEKNETLENCHECHSAGDPHLQTFDGTLYNFYGKCNYTMVQKGVQGYTTPFIAAHFKGCGPPFSDSVSCNGDITIKHNDHVAITISVGAIVEVNGVRVDLPFSLAEDNLFIWDEGLDIKLITFSGFYVRYMKNAVMPGIYIYAPETEMNQGWSGLCGQYTGTPADDPHARHGDITNIPQFATSWNTRASTKIPDCQDELATVLPVCSEELIRKFEPKCTHLLQLAEENCTPLLTKEGCLEDMCGCRPGKEDICLLAIKHRLENQCGALRMDCPVPGTTAPAGAAPVTTTPAGAAPVTTTLAGAAPVTTIPAGAAPVTTAPAGAAPVTTTLVRAAPVTTTPAGAAPVTTTPAGAAPVTTTPAGAAPVTTIPAGAAPVTTTLVRAAPVTTTPAGAAPVTTTPTGACRDEDGEVYQDWERFLRDCKEFICRQAKVFLAKDAGKGCCMDEENHAFHSEGERYTKFVDDQCLIYDCTGGQELLFGPCY